MGNSTEIIEQRHWQHWQLKEFELANGLNIGITSPSGFSFGVPGRSNLVRLLTKLTWKGEITLPDGTRFYIDASGNISILDFDKWNNENFEFDQVIGTVRELAEAIGSHLIEHLWKK